MKFLADENVDKPIVEKLRKNGHVVHYVTEMEPSISDDEVIKLANQESALLLTEDKDFGELIYRQGRIFSGVVLIRLSGLSLRHKVEVVAMAVQEHADELVRNFTVIAPSGVRIRKRTSLVDENS